MKLDINTIVIDIIDEYIAYLRDKIELLEHEKRKYLNAAADEAENEMQDSRGPAADGDEIKSAAVTLGSLGGKKGGPARAQSLSADRRSAIARKAANVRWDKKETDEKSDPDINLDFNQAGRYHFHRKFHK